MTGRKRHKISTLAMTGNAFYFWFDLVLIVLSLFALILGNKFILIALSLCGLLPVLWSAIRALLRTHLTIDLLASIALIFALINSEFRSAVFISLMLASARVLAYYTENRTRRAIQSLLKLKPLKVLVKTDKGIIEKAVGEVKLGDLVIVESGERVAVDGTVIEGSASIDQSSLTGESEPVTKKIGDEVFSSTLNVSGSLLVKTTKVGEDTTFAKILKLIDESQKGKSAISSVTEKFVNIYILITILGSVLLYFFTQNLSMVLAVLLVTCADDVAIAIPLAFIAATGTMAKRGIIVKGASFIEGLPKVKMIIFDKTGTLTEGKPRIDRVLTFNNYTEEKLLSLVAGLIVESNHPTSRAINTFTKEKNISPAEANQIHEEPGYGIDGVVEGKKIFSGNVRFLKSNGIKLSEEESAAINEAKNRGRMVVAIAVDKELAGIITLTNPIRHGADKVISDLYKLGIKRIVILTGDNEMVANSVAKELGIHEFQANLLPQDKVNFIKHSIHKKYKVAMVGDGVNDAASLALADIGIAMGAIGSDAAVEAADIALMKDDLRKIIDAVEMGKRTMNVINQDLVLWGVTNVVGLGLVFAGIFGPAAAAAYNFLTDFIPPLNSLRLFKFQKQNL
jgi:Cd2+/Zn2+-exporting ATPase